MSSSSSAFEAKHYCQTIEKKNSQITIQSVQN
jgi:hypothetical protein